MEPVYAEYNIGHYARSFTLSNKVDKERISANLEDPRGRRVDAHAAKGQGRPAAEDRNRVNGIAVRRKNDETAATASRRFLGLGF
jgi:hypothetical protein